MPARVRVVRAGLPAYLPPTAAAAEKTAVVVAQQLVQAAAGPSTLVPGGLAYAGGVCVVLSIGMQ